MNINSISAPGGIDRSTELGKINRGGLPQESFGEVFGSKIKEAAEDPANTPASSSNARNIDMEKELGLLNLLRLDSDTKKMAAYNVREKGMAADEAVYKVQSDTGRLP
ncbi:MAG: hypothetical protein LBU70_09535 [Chitinispirillales bacterium]|jgi:hypothetical protein|nr:hypothetical protein [Chitinispirillales bacterium]